MELHLIDVVRGVGGLRRQAGPLVDRRRPSWSLCRQSSSPSSTYPPPQALRVMSHPAAPRMTSTHNGFNYQHDSK